MVHATNLSILLAACSFQQYAPKAIDTAAITKKIESKNPAGEPFHQYLLDNGYPANIFPLQQWGLDELTYCALFFHPSLDVARAQWHAAELSEVAASKRLTPSISGHIAHSNQANQDIRPFAFGLSIDIPTDLTNKRDIRIENAHHLSQAAKLGIAQIAWDLRNQVAQSLYEYQQNQKMVTLLLNEQEIRHGIVALYQKRVSLGAASNIELSTAKLQLQTSTTELNTWQRNQLVTLSKLANNLGLPLSQVKSLNLIDGTLSQPLQQTLPQPDELQTTALLNRLDIRIALERYAAAEARLKLEIAKQYPDIVISPGYAYEFGDKIWSLNLSSLLTLLNKNKVAIDEATQLREVEAAQFEALQTKVISDTNIADASVLQAKQSLDNQQALLIQQQQNTQRMERRFAAGEIDRLELSYSKLESNVAEKNVVLATFQYKSAINQLENTLQQPLFISKNSVLIEHINLKK
ncbi:outer membrane efflux protein [mine drainage metagenome]|uniref:Outer membrane efflux protein n=1 Tax=mine drainage metagenome TaxID=410659 RepID=A0A1J5SKB8_9ZZZZ